MSEVIMNPFSKKKNAQCSKNLCSIRDRVAKLLLFLRYTRLGGGAVEYQKSGAMVEYLFIERSLGAGGYFVFSYGIAAYIWQQ
jgi:hypothetical protein